jgi:hypothetical protein
LSRAARQHSLGVKDARLEVGYARSRRSVTVGHLGRNVCLRWRSVKFKRSDSKWGYVDDSHCWVIFLDCSQVVGKISIGRSLKVFKIGASGGKMLYVFLVLTLAHFPLQAHAEYIFLACVYQTNTMTVNAQGEMIQDRLQEYKSEIEIMGDRYYMTLFDHEYRRPSEGTVIASSRRYFLNSKTGEYDDVVSLISSQMFIDRITREYYMKEKFIHNDTKSITSMVSHGTCELEDAPITKF